MTLERPLLFQSGRDILIFLAAALLLFSLSLLQKYENYRLLTQFDDAIIHAHVIKQYIKHNKSKSYYVLKLRTEHSTFYTSASKNIRDLKGRDIDLKIWPSKLTFYGFVKGTYLRSHITKVYPDLDAKTVVANGITQQHETPLMAELFGALFTAASMSKELQKSLSALGISHLLAISGFHLGIISALLYFLLRTPYRLLQESYFPYRSASRDIFVIVLVVLSLYLYFLGSIPSLLRAFTMLLIGFVLYDRGIKVISMQTLFLTTVLLIALMPSLLFSMGFWLSISGVFYIFLYLIHFQHNNNIYNFLGLSIWVYIMMLPISLYFFGTFSIYHPLSIIASILFWLFYVISAVLHVILEGGIVDSFLNAYLNLSRASQSVTLPLYALIMQLTLSLIAIKNKKSAWTLLAFCLFIFMGAIQHVA